MGQQLIFQNCRVREHFLLDIKGVDFQVAHGCKLLHLEGLNELALIVGCLN